MRSALLAGGLCILAGLAPTTVSADRGGPEVTGGQCTRLRSAAHPGLEIVSATRVPSGRFAANGQGFDVPASCRLVGVIRGGRGSRIGFELWLPDDWNGRYSQLGNGGFAGNIDHASLANEIRRHNATAMTDTGHKGSQFDASWALGHPERVIDYGYRSIKVTADAARSLIADYYGRRPRHRYFIGCSNGGRQALMAAQRYPEDWDGILAGSPAVQWTRQLATFAAIQHRLRSAPANWIPASKLAPIQRLAVSACSPSPGEQCRLDVRRMLCSAADRPDCLTRAQAASLELIQSGPRDARGRPLYPGFEPTAAALPGNWDRWILNPDRNAPSDLTFATQAYRYMVLDQRDWKVEDFDSARDFSRASERQIQRRPLSAILDADDTDLSRFARHGGRMIMYVGGADAVISPASGLSYYRRTAQRMGSLARTRRFFRLFDVPGMQHCQGGLAPNAFGQAWVAPPLAHDPRHDIRMALEDWVEHGRAPRSIVAAKYENDQPQGRLVATQDVGAFPDAARAVSTGR